MTSPLNNLFELSISLIETGIIAVHTGARRLRGGIGTATQMMGRNWHKKAPVNGPLKALRLRHAAFGIGL